MKALIKASIFFLLIVAASFINKVHAANYTLTKESDAFPVMYQDYTDQMEDTYTIQTGINIPVSISYELDIESDCDYLEIYNLDNSGNLTLLASLTGYVSGTVTTTTSNGKAVVKIITDGSVSGGYGYEGYNLSYKLNYSSLPAAQSYTYGGNTILPVGNVGIGKTNPGYALDVQRTTITGMGNFQSTAATGSNRTGGVRAQTNTAMGDFLAIANNANLPYSSLDGVYVMNRTSNGNMYFTTNNNGTEAKVISLTSSGRVGIGTSSPDYKLDVNGTIRATEIKVVSPDSFPDYVFDKGHYLPKLNEVRQYIADNGHLPGIQSASDAKVNGIDLVDMQMKLLKKMEEMTLYILEQQNTIERLDKILDAVKTK